MIKFPYARMAISCMVITLLLCLHVAHQWRSQPKKEVNEEVIMPASNTDLHDLLLSIFIRN